MMRVECCGIEVPATPVEAVLALALADIGDE